MFWKKKEFTSDQLRYKPDFTKWDTEKLSNYQSDLNHFLYILFYDIKAWILDNPIKGQHRVEVTENFAHYQLKRQLEWYYDDHLVLKINRTDAYYRSNKFGCPEITLETVDRTRLTESNASPNIEHYCYGEWSLGIRGIREFCIAQTKRRKVQIKAERLESERLELVAKLGKAANC